MRIDKLEVILESVKYGTKPISEAIKEINELFKGISQSHNITKDEDNIETTNSPNPVRCFGCEFKKRCYSLRN